VLHPLVSATDNLRVAVLIKNDRLQLLVARHPLHRGVDPVTEQARLALVLLVRADVAAAAGRHLVEHVLASAVGVLVKVALYRPESLQDALSDIVVPVPRGCTKLTFV